MGNASETRPIHGRFPLDLLEYRVERSPYGRSDPDQRAWRSFRPGISEMDPSAPGGPNNGHALTKGKALSNAMRSGKRVLAGVAAGALSLGVLSFVGATSASALTGAATVTPVRATFTGSTLDQVPYARAVFKAPMAGAAVGVSLAIAPDGGTLKVDTPSSDDSTVTLLTPAVGALVTAASADDSYVQIKATAAGTYSGQIFNGTDTFTYSFTTTGKPASMTLTPATQTTPTGGVANFALSLKDAAGNVTQPGAGDTITLASSPAAGITLTNASYNATQLYKGAVDDTAITTAAGTYTVTATPLGNLPSQGVTAQSTTIVASGTITDDTPALAVTVPTNALAVSTAVANAQTQVPGGSATITVRVTTSAANATVRLRASVAAGSVNGKAAGTFDYQDVTTGANKIGTANFVLGGNAVLNGQALTIQQVKADNTVPAAGGAKLTVTQLAPVISADSITVSPDDSVVGKIGTPVPVKVLVEDDSFGIPQAGWTIQAFRGATAAAPSTLLGSATTNAAGEATLDLSNAAGIATGTVERYSFYATIGGSAVSVNNRVQVTWSTDGGVTSVGYNQNAGSPTTGITATTTVTKAPLVNVIGSVVGGVIPTGGPSAATFTLSTGKDDTTVIGGYYSSLTGSSSPANAITYTAPAGVFVTDDTTTATWKNGSSTITVSNGSTVYVYGTKTGVHDIVISSGGKSVTAKVKMRNQAADAYNIALSPKTQDAGPGEIGRATLRVTDIFGNPVDTSTGGADVTIRATGQILLAGYQVQNTQVQTDSTGEASIVFIAGTTTGNGILTAGPSTTVTATAWATSPYTPPTGAPAPITSDAATVVVKGANPPSDKSITITGSRTTVSGKPGIKIDGVVTGIDNGKTVIPYFRFPGETTFAEGSARPEITDGSFTWQRKTGKKFYAYVTSDDGAVKSNRVIIPAN